MPSPISLSRSLIAVVLTLTVNPPALAQESEPDAERETVSVAFATNRARIDGKDGPGRYGNDPGPLRYGICRVEFDPIGFLQNAARHISLRFPTEMEDIVTLEESDPDTFWPQFKDAGAEGEAVAFYIHGYKMDFDKACKRTALLQRQLGEDVRLLLFAWPSQDNMALYTQDETRMKTSVPDIKAVLERMVSTFGTGEVHAMGHSLGTRGVTAAVAGMAAGDAPLLDELVLVAPDMDRFDFETAHPALSDIVSGTTIYASEDDGPLRVSQEVHGVPRIGQGGQFLTLFEGVETIDITDAPRRDIIRHNYHYFNSKIAEDMRLLLAEGKRAAERPGLQEKSANGKTYWQMNGEKR